MQRIPSPEETLQNKFRAALSYATSVCILGADNRIEDIERTNGWVLCQPFRYKASGRYRPLSYPFASIAEMRRPNGAYNPDTGSFSVLPYEWLYHVDDMKEFDSERKTPFEFDVIARFHLSPLDDDSFKLEPHHKSLLLNTLLSHAMRSGNCGARSHLVGKYLWENPQGIQRIEALSMGNIDHVFVVVNRHHGHLKKPETWGKNAWIIDAWYEEGLIYPASRFAEYFQKIKEFATYQQKQLREIGFSTSRKVSSEAENIDERIWEIKPKHHIYPRYSPGMRIEDYYYLHDYRYPDATLYYSTFPAFHKSKFKHCLEEIKQLSLPANRNAFFQQKKKPDAHSTKIEAARKPSPKQ